MMIPAPQLPSQPAVLMRAALSPRLRQVFFASLSAGVASSGATQSIANAVTEISRPLPLSEVRLTSSPLIRARQRNGDRPGDGGTPLHRTTIQRILVARTVCQSRERLRSDAVRDEQRSQPAADFFKVTRVDFIERFGRVGIHIQHGAHPARCIEHRHDDL